MAMKKTEEREMGIFLGGIESMPLFAKELVADAGGVAGGLPKTVVAPLNVSRFCFRGIYDCFLRTSKESGFRGLYRGVAPSLYGIFPCAGLKFYFYEEMKSYVPEEHKKDIKVKLVCGSVTGLLGQTFTYPLDVVRRQMQVQRIAASNTAELKGTMETLVMIAQKQGWKQLF